MYQSNRRHAHVWKSSTKAAISLGFFPCFPWCSNLRRFTKTKSTCFRGHLGSNLNTFKIAYMQTHGKCKWAGRLPKTPDTNTRNPWLRGRIIAHRLPQNKAKWQTQFWSWSTENTQEHQEKAPESKLSKLIKELRNFWRNYLYASDPAYVLQKRHPPASTATSKSASV